MQTVSGLGAKMADETPKGPPARPDNRRRRLLRAGVALLIMVGGGYWGFGWLEHRLGVVIENDKLMEEVARIVAESKRGVGPDIVTKPFIVGPTARRPIGSGGR